MTSIGNEVWTQVSDMNNSKRARLVSLVHPSDDARKERLRERVASLQMPIVSRLVEFLTEPQYSSVVTPASCSLLVDAIISSPEDPRDNHWSGTLIEALCSMNFLRTNYPQLVSTRLQEEAVLRFTVAIAETYMTDKDFVHYYYDDDLSAYALRVEDVSIIELVCAYPQQWERVSGLILENGLHDPEQIKLVLDGTVPPSLASGVL